VTEDKKIAPADWMPQAVVIAMLLIAFKPDNPEGYSTVLRWVACGCFAYLAYRAYEKDQFRWTWRLGIVAVVYNPFFSVHFDRTIGLIVYAITIVIAIGSIVAFKPPKQ
jgi:hypothetical protein